MPVGVCMPFFTFGPSWVAHLSSWGRPQSIFFHGLEDSYVHFNRGEKVETGAILGVGGFARSVEDGRGTNVSRESWFGANEVSGDLVSSASSPF
jgi:hypothetical protein